MRKFTAGLAFATIISTAWIGAAQGAYPLPLRSVGGQACFPEERCETPWVRYRGRAGSLYERDHGFFCKPTSRFCWTEGYGSRDGHGCACGGRTPAGSDWRRATDRTKEIRAEIIRNVIEPCFRASIIKAGLLKQMSMDEAMKLMKILQTSQIERMVKTVSPIVSGKRPLVRLKIYRWGEKVCRNASRNARRKR